MHSFLSSWIRRAAWRKSTSWTPSLRICSRRMMHSRPRCRRWKCCPWISLSKQDFLLKFPLVNSTLLLVDPMPSMPWASASLRRVSSVTSAMSSTSMRPRIVHSRLARIVITRRHRVPRPTTMRRSASYQRRANTAIPVKVTVEKSMQSFLETNSIPLAIYL